MAARVQLKWISRTETNFVMTSSPTDITEDSETVTQEDSVPGREAAGATPEAGVPQPTRQSLKSASAASGSESAISAANVRRARYRRPPAWASRLVALVRRCRRWFRFGLRQWLHQHRHELTGYAISASTLCLIALILAGVVLPRATVDRFVDSFIGVAEESRKDNLEQQLEVTIEPEDLVMGEVDSNLKQLLSDFDDGTQQEELHSVEREDPTTDLVPTDSEMMHFLKAGELGGRSEAGRNASLKKYGGTQQSEKAVMSGLRWLQQRQQKDGSWNFRKVGPQAAAGRFDRTEVGSTSLALLCFLGAGHTHRSEGPYQQTVQRGLQFIVSQAEDVQGTADLRGEAQGNSGMYVQGLATICIAEAYGLERRDEELEELTQRAAAFIERSQDPIGGGWRYEPREEGDTSVVGWQVMALQSARTGRVRVSSKTFHNVREFLRSVSGDDRGSTYKYRPDDERARNSMTAVGLLCRLYLGWPPDFETMQAGVARLAAAGPSPTNLYYNYYATQVLHHTGGERWRKWNEKMREQLIRTQIQKGPAAGSWAPTDSHGRTGGQLYQTALSILTLEVYYRHLPMYQRLKHDPVVVLD